MCQRYGRIPKQRRNQRGMNRPIFRLMEKIFLYTASSLVVANVSGCPGQAAARREDNLFHNPPLRPRLSISCIIMTEKIHKILRNNQTGQCRPSLSRVRSVTLFETLLRWLAHEVIQFANPFFQKKPSIKQEANSSQMKKSRF